MLVILRFHFFHTRSTKAIREGITNKIAFGFTQRDGTALAIGHRAGLALKGAFASRTEFLFVLHTVGGSWFKNMFFLMKLKVESLRLKV
jgi:hypothetical protein